MAHTPDHSAAEGVGRPANWAILGGVIVTAGLATVANQLHGWPAWAFAIIAIASGSATLSSATVGWPIRALAEDDMGRLRRRTVKVANEIKNCDPKGVEIAPHRPMSPYGIRATMAGALKDVREGSRAVTRQKARKLTPRRIARLRRLIDDLAVHGLRDEHLEPYLSRDPTTRECIPLSDYLWGACFRPQDVR
jgi:hypothetical protein